MKHPLHYQLSEYDCGPTSMLNAISYLFDRKEIPPEIIRNIMLYCLDCFGEDGRSGRKGTSCTAMMFLSNWLNSFGQAGHLLVSSQYLSGKAVNLSQNSRLRDALNRQGVAVVRLDLEGWHYVLLTGIQNGLVRLFDPYYFEGAFPDPSIRIVIHGKSTHVSTPQLGIDALYIASQIVVSVQALVTRLTSPTESVIIGIGKMKAGTTYNALAETAVLEGTTRTVSQESREQTRERIDQAVRNTAAVYGGTADIIWTDITSALINDPVPIR